MTMMTMMTMTAAMVAQARQLRPAGALLVAPGVVAVAVLVVTGTVQRQRAEAPGARFVLTLLVATTTMALIR
jgi:hypothetical protein